MLSKKIINSVLRVNVGAKLLFRKLLFQTLIGSRNVFHFDTKLSPAIFSHNSPIRFFVFQQTYMNDVKVISRICQCHKY